jgi:hypothetical protein
MPKSKNKAEKKHKHVPVNAKPEHYFILVTGVPLKNLKELANSLENMNDWVFSHHVNDSRNDFSNWIKDILGENELAEEIKSMKNIRQMEARILKHLVNKYL